MKENHRFSNGVEVVVTDNKVKVYSKPGTELTHPHVNREYVHAAMFLTMVERSE